MKTTSDSPRSHIHRSLCSCQSYFVFVCLTASALSMISAFVSRLQLEEMKAKLSAQDATLRTMQTHITQLEWHCSTRGSGSSHSDDEQDTNGGKSSLKYDDVKTKNRRNTDDTSRTTGCSCSKGEPGPRGKRGRGGPQGPPGQRGENGISGVNGAHGAPGLPGRNGLKGEEGSAGEKGEKGQRGDKGDKGQAGRQGTHTMVNTSITAIKPSAHIVGDETLGVPGYGPLRLWVTSSSKGAHLNGGMQYSNGAITVPQSGVYHIYSQLLYFEGHVDKMGHKTLVNGVTKMVSVTQPFKWRWTSHHGGLFRLSKGDRIEVQVTNSDGRLFMLPTTCFFGAYLL